MDNTVEEVLTMAKKTGPGRGRKKEYPVWVTIRADEKLKATILELARQDRRKPSEMARILLEDAVAAKLTAKSGGR